MNIPTIHRRVDLRELSGSEGQIIQLRTSKQLYQFREGDWYRKLIFTTKEAGDILGVPAHVVEWTIKQYPVADVRYGYHGRMRKGPKLSWKAVRHLSKLIVKPNEKLVKNLETSSPGG